MSWKQRFFAFLGVAGCLLLGLCSQEASFNRLRDMRVISRIPESQVNWVIEGEVQLNGKAQIANKILKAPHTHTQCLYYRYLVERLEEDSDGDSYWRTIRDEHASVDFDLRDINGDKILLRAKAISQLAETFNVDSDFSTREGDMRYTEYRIEPGTQVFVFGFAKLLNGGQCEVDFRAEGLYLPIISERTVDEERRMRAASSMGLCFLSLLFLSSSFVFLCWILHIHRVLAFLVLVSSGLAFALVWYATSMMHDDLVSARDRVMLHKERASRTIASMLYEGRVGYWSGDWYDMLPLQSALHDLSEKKVDRIHGIRNGLNAGVRRTNEIRNRFPENILAPVWGVRRLQEIPPLGKDTVPEKEHSLEIQRVPLSFISLIWMFPVALALGGFCIPWGFRKIKTKRYIENIPTSPTAGLAHGPGELFGTVELPEGQPPLESPIQSLPCVYYHYIVKERRGSGKKAKWVIITDRTQSMDFLCRDSEGTVLINPQDAEIYSKHSHSIRRGNRIYIETWMQVEDPLYALGSAELDTEQMDRLILQKNKDFPFLLANLPERQVLLRKSRAAIFTTNLGLNGVMLLVLTLFGISGSYAATDYLFAALVAPAFCGFMMVALMFNDLIFLRQRVKRAWANIQVSLKKRSELVPNLLEVAKAYQLHEQELQETLVDLRADAKRVGDMNASEAGEFLGAESAVVTKLLAVREEYPDLKANTLTEDLMRRIVGLENEVALMRNGYNDSVERHNTKILHFPEVAIANFFKFKSAEYFHADIEHRDFTKVDFTTDDSPRIHEEVDKNNDPEENSEEDPSNED